MFAVRMGPVILEEEKKQEKNSYDPFMNTLSMPEHQTKLFWEGLNIPFLEKKSCPK